MSKAELEALLNRTFEPDVEAEVVVLDDHRPPVVYETGDVDPDDDPGWDDEAEKAEADDPEPEAEVTASKPETGSLRFTMDRKALVKALLTLKGVAGRSALPILGSMKATVQGDLLRIEATDLDISAVGQWTVGDGSDGTAIIPIAVFKDLVAVSKAPTVTVQANTDGAEITVDGAAIRCGKADDWPLLPELGGNGRAYTLFTPTDWQAIERVAVAASADQTRPTLTGLWFEPEAGHLRVVATDSYRLGVADLAAYAPEGIAGVLVPRRLIRVWSQMRGKTALAKTAGQTFGFGAYAKPDRHSWVNAKPDRHSWVSLTCDEEPIMLTGRTIDGTFPNYRNLISLGYQAKIAFDREELAVAMAGAKPFAADHIPVRLTLSGNWPIQMTVTWQSVGGFKATLPISQTVDGGVNMTIAFNWTYLSDGLEACGDGPVEMLVVDPLKPAILRPAGDDRFIYLLMPVRV